MSHLVAGLLIIGGVVLVVCNRWAAEEYAGIVHAGPAWLALIRAMYCFLGLVVIAGGIVSIAVTASS